MQKARGDSRSASDKLSERLRFLEKKMTDEREVRFRSFANQADTVLLFFFSDVSGVRFFSKHFIVVVSLPCTLENSQVSGKTCLSAHASLLIYGIHCVEDSTELCTCRIVVRHPTLPPRFLTTGPKNVDFKRHGSVREGNGFGRICVYQSSRWRVGAGAH